MLLNEKDLPLVDMDFMNDTHKEELNLINDICKSIDEYATKQDIALINSNYKTWQNHTVEHFKAEENMMIEKKFPPYLMHKSIHDMELKKMDAIFKSWQEENDISILKNYFDDELPKWLINHIKTMDTVTASFFKNGTSSCGLMK